MKKLNKVAMLFASAALAAPIAAVAAAHTGMAATPTAEQFKFATGENNWRSTDGTVWKNGTNELCWRNGFWTRLAGLGHPALFIWGDADKLVPAAFSRHVADALPNVRQVVLPECGHVPQVELPETTGALLREHLRDVSGAALPASERRAGRRFSALRRAAV